MKKKIWILMMLISFLIILTACEPKRDQNYYPDERDILPDYTPINDETKLVESMTKLNLRIT